MYKPIKQLDSAQRAQTSTKVSNSTRNDRGFKFRFSD